MITRYAPDGAVAAANHLAAAAGAAMLERGGNAVDAAIATAAGMAVTAPHMCGLGGDLFALISAGSCAPVALNASGRAGSGADAERLRAGGSSAMPFMHDVRSVTVPGCVDGLVSLHERFATMGLEELLAPARRLAHGGFPVSPTLAQESNALAPEARAAAFGHSEALIRGRGIVLQGVDRALADLARGGRAGFYEGSVGTELLTLGAGEFTDDDLRARQADWVEPLALAALGRKLWTVPPNSQGYLALSSAWIADSVGIPQDPADEYWAFLLVEASRQAAFDRVAVLNEHADGTALISPARLEPRAAAVRGVVSRGLADVYDDGGTTYLCAVDRDRTCVSLIMSNGADFGSRLVLPDHGIFLHNRGIGFSLKHGHPAEYGPRRRPPHTLAPLLVTDTDNVVDTVLGTMGGDAQPQILLQLLTRLLMAGQEAGEAVEAPRWVLSGEARTGFDSWEGDDPLIVLVEHGAPPAWTRGLRRRGYDVAESSPGDQSFGHAQIIRITDDNLLSGAADPRSGDGAFIGR